MANLASLALQCCSPHRETASRENVVSAVNKAGKWPKIKCNNVKQGHKNTFSILKMCATPESSLCVSKSLWRPFSSSKAMLVLNHSNPTWYCMIPGDWITSLLKEESFFLINNVFFFFYFSAVSSNCLSNCLVLFQKKNHFLATLTEFNVLLQSVPGFSFAQWMTEYFQSLNINLFKNRNQALEEKNKLSDHFQN